MVDRLSEQVVVVTGASAGVGRAVVRELAARGARVGLLARGERGLEATREDVERAGSQACTVPTDVSDPAQVEQAASRVEEALGPIDVWINSAMVTVLSELEDMTAEELRRVTEVTYLGAAYGTQSALRRMRPRDRGHIIQVGSALAYRSIPLQSAYCGAKHAIRGFTDSLRCELIHQGSHVHVTMLQLPGLNTPQFVWGRARLPKEPQPVPPIFQPEVAARAIVETVGHRRREVYVGASSVQAIVGQKVVPGLLDHFMARKAYPGQQTERDRGADRKDNLFEPLDATRDYGAHGPFDAEAKGSSLQVRGVMRWTRWLDGIRRFFWRLTRAFATK